MDKRNEEILENSMVLQEMPERETLPKLDYKEKAEEEIYLGEDILQQLREMKTEVQNALAVREGYQNYQVTNVVHYNKDVELVAIETGEPEYLDLSVVTAEELETGEIIEIYYLNGEEADISQLMKEYESPIPIKELVIATDKNLELDSEEQDQELVKYDLNELEKEEQEKSLKKEKKQNENENIAGDKPRYMVQTIDVDKTYVDDKTTVRNAFNIPKQVTGLAIARPLQGDENVLAADLTMYMLDSSGKVIEESEGKKINDLFQVDRATGKSPITDENTKFELGGYAERNKNHTLRRFISKENPDMHLSVEQQTITEYAQVYAGRKTMNGNDSVEVQLETRNIPVQTSLAMQKVSAGYKGLRNIKNIDEEVDSREADGDDLRNIPVENADGKENTVEENEINYIPGTEITWEELSEETGESIPKLQDRFNRELADGKEPDYIVAEIEYDYEMLEHENGRI